MVADCSFGALHLFIILVTLISLSRQSFQDNWPTTRVSSEETDFVGSIKNLTVQVGKDAVLSCTVNNLGRYKVAWLRAEDQTVLSLQTKVVTHNSRISVTFDGLRTWELRIRHVKESDKGCYMCEINTSTLKIQKGCIDVSVPPDIINDETSGDISVLEGENTTLSCRATGKPRPRISWSREDGRRMLIRKGPKDFIEVDTYNGSHLRFHRLDRRQMGAYLCIASNDVPPAVSKRIVLNVNFAPVIKVPNQLLGSPLGAPVHLECHVEAFPNTVNYWMKNRGEMLLNGTKYAIREEKVNYSVLMVLVVNNFHPRDTGTYNCVSTNSLGKAEGTLRLYEIQGMTGTQDYRYSIEGGLAEAARGHHPPQSASSPLAISHRVVALCLVVWTYCYR